MDLPTPSDYAKAALQKAPLEVKAYFDYIDLTHNALRARFPTLAADDPDVFAVLVAATVRPFHYWLQDRNPPPTPGAASSQPVRASPLPVEPVGSFSIPQKVIDNLGDVWGIEFRSIYGTPVAEITRGLTREDFQIVAQNMEGIGFRYVGKDKSPTGKGCFVRA